MADTLCLVGTMDSLWFFQLILFPEPISLLCPKTTLNIPPQPIQTSITAPSSNTSQSSLQDQDFPLHSSQLITPPTPKDDSSNEDDQEQERLTRLRATKPKTRSHSSSPTTTPKQQPSKKLYYSNSMGALPTKTMVRNCKSLWDLEREEVKGFIDLGFIFKKEQISERMIRVLPGLQRLEEFKNTHRTDQLLAVMDAAAAEVAGCKDDDDDIVDDQEDDEEEKEEKRKRGGVMRPYLSEAWLIKRPDSPLLNLRIPRASAADDMKKHLRFWARTVASEIQQES